MSRLVCIVGLPGSGKTCLAQEFVQQGFILVDDPCTYEEVLEVKEALLMGYDVVITGTDFCKAQVRAAAEKDLQRQAEWIFFENDPEQCRRNVALRNDDRYVEPDIRVLSRVYQIPEGAKALPVWRSLHN